MTEAILFALGEWTVRSTILAAVVGVLLWALRVHNPHLRLAAWTFVLAGVMLMPLMTALMPPVSLWIPSKPAVASVGDSVAPPMPALDPVSEIFSARPSVSWPQMALGVWFAVAIAMLARIVVGVGMSSELVKRSHPVDTGVRESRAVHVPVTMGLFRPTILLPSDWCQWPSEKLNAVLAHEKAHVERRDSLRQCAASVYRSVAWFHPLSWWLRGEVTALAELASDDVAISLTGDRIAYAETVLSFMERAKGGVRLHAIAMASRGTRTRRLERLLDPKHLPSSPPQFPTVLGWTALVLPVLYLVALGCRGSAGCHSGG